MGVLKRGMLFLASAGILAIPAVIPSTLPAPNKGNVPYTSPAIPGPGIYEPNQVEYYLDEATLAYINPGLKVTIISVADVAPGKKPTVEVTVTDEKNQPLDRLGYVTPGAVTLRFAVAAWDAAARSYDNVVYTTGNPTTDSAGAFTMIENGRYKYTFANPLSTFDPAKPATLFVRSSRNVTELAKTYYANVFKDFVPSTGAAATTWNATSWAKCNACHDLTNSSDVSSPAWPHGRNYREIKTCALCHNPTDMTGSRAEFNGQGYWHAVHAGLASDIGPITYPIYPFGGGGLKNCETCHDPKAAGGNSWYTYPSRASCGGCHGDINWETGANHPAGAQKDDAECAKCHAPEGDQEFDASIKGAHVIPEKSKQLKGLKASIEKVEGAEAGKAPTVTFKVTNGDNTAVDPTKLSTFSPILAGPSMEYTWYAREDARSKAVYDAATGLAKYTFTKTLPADAKDFTVSADIYRNINLKRGDGKPDTTVRECATNPVFYAVAGNVAVSPVPKRRTIVSLTKCNACHDRLALHGGQRLVIEECVICHNPKETDVSRRPAGDTPESIQMARMIHRIHMGEELKQEYTVYGFGTAPPYPAHNYNEVLYPGDRRNCLGCHNAGTYNLPAPTEALPVEVKRDYFSPQYSGTVSCLGCHDVRDAAAHAYLNTASFGEACGTCHGTNSEWSPTKSHAR